MINKDFMNLAIEEAKNAEKQGGAPISSIIVKDDKVIAKGWSTVGTDLDPSGHNDLNCIRATCKTLNTLDLDGCTMYSTIEPCSMCLGCASWAGLPMIVFGAYQKDISANPYETENYSAELRAKDMVLPNGKHMEVTGGVLRNECAQLLQNYRNWFPLK